MTFSNVLLRIILLQIIQFYAAEGIGEVVYAINAGGEAHTDVFGVRYQRDPLSGLVGTASDYGKQLMIGRVPPGDQILYQTERYHHSTFGYDLPLRGDGSYVLVLKFCEVYFNMPNQKVFDITVNKEHVVVPGIDIFARAGRGIAHDEYIPFTVKGNRMTIEGEESIIQSGSVRVDFVKGYKDNPKINALVLIKGFLEDIPKLPPLPREEEMDGGMGGMDDRSFPGAQSAKRRPSGPKTPDPYSMEESGSYLPIFVALGAAIPILFCLCRL